jgi:hypothetical protein
MTVFGELARGAHPASAEAETHLAMALALGKPDPPDPPFSTVPVFLDGYHIGRAECVRWVWGGSCYHFVSVSEKTKFSVSNKQELLFCLKEMLGLTS